MNWLEQIAPTIATALGGPLAGAAAEFLASKLGASDKTVEGIQQTLSGMTGADLIKLKELDLDFQKHMADNGIALQMAQVQVDVEEAKNVNLFVSGWRPAIGWICAFALAYQYLLRPLSGTIASLFGVVLPPLPGLDDNLWQLLTGMLGIGGLRTIEKVQGVASK
jgi:hypothetical protein